MKGRFLLGSNNSPIGINIYANRSSVVLDWLLTTGINRENISLRDVVKECNISIGTVQRVFNFLVINGLLYSEGVRTSKKFILKNPNKLLKSWIDHYKIIDKCKIWTYQSGIQSKEKILQVLQKSNLKEKVALALHSAAEAHKCKNTNLNTVELYMLDSNIKNNLEETLELEPQERGYDVLLIQPYYKTLLDRSNDRYNSIRVSPSLLTFLDLYHFPLRGQEQAEFMAENTPLIKKIIKNG